MKTNLLILDSYKNIENLIQFAFSFSNKFKRNLKLYYVFDFNWMRQTAMVGATGIASASILNAEKSAHKEYEVAETKIRTIVTEYLKKNSTNFPIDINVTRNSRIDIINYELEKDPDLLVLISNHQSYSEITDGLVSYPKLIEYVKCPVLIIPDNIKQAELQNVVYATDYNPEDVQSLKHLSNFMKQSEKAHITILHNEQEYNFREKLQWTGFKNIVQSEINSNNLDFALKNNKDFLTGIEEFTEESNPDMLAIMKEKKGFFEDLFTENKTKYVLTHFHKPVLVYHENQKI